MHPRTKAKTKEIARTILDMVGQGIMTLAIFSSPRLYMGKTEEILGELSGYTYSRIRRTIKRLQMQDMIKYDENDIKSPIRLTEKGMIRLTGYRLRDHIKNCLKKRKKRWDYFWRMVVFDIIEKKRHIRKALRRELIAAGFYPLQKSTLVCPFDCEKEILELCKFYGVSNDVLFCVTPSLGQKEDDVREFFFSRGKQVNKN